MATSSSTALAVTTGVIEWVLLTDQRGHLPVHELLGESIVLSDVDDARAHHVGDLRAEQYGAGRLEYRREDVGAVEREHLAADTRAERVGRIICADGERQHEGDDEADDDHPQRLLAPSLQYARRGRRQQRRGRGDQTVHFAQSVSRVAHARTGRRVNLDKLRRLRVCNTDLKWRLQLSNRVRRVTCVVQQSNCDSFRRISARTQAAVGV